MTSALIGYTGFVGGNLLRAHMFDDLYNSKNIESIAGRSYDLLVCAGAPAEKWKANQNPTADRAVIERLIDNLRSVQAKQLVLISTVDVYPTPMGVMEDTLPDWSRGSAYGRHRRQLEEFAMQQFATFIIRLPGLFGPGLKKNVIYDFLHGRLLENLHADAQYQFYGLSNLWSDIRKAQEANLSILNAATEPVTVAEVASIVFKKEFQSRPAGVEPSRYDMRSLHDALYGGSNGYLQKKSRVLSELKTFVAAERPGT